MTSEKEFLARFNPSGLDSFVKYAFQFILLSCEAMVLAAGFKYGDEVLGIWQLRIAYVVLLGGFSLYVGTQTAMVVSGLLNKGAKQVGWRLHGTVILAAVLAGGMVFLTRNLSEAVVASQKAAPAVVVPPAYRSNDARKDCVPRPPGRPKPSAPFRSPPEGSASPGASPAGTRNHSSAFEVGKALSTEIKECH